MNNSQDDLVLFLQTPRGGEWNHRFIIPDNRPEWNDAFLGEYRQKLNQAGTAVGVKIAAETRQDGGRIGEEVLYFYYRNFSRLPKSVQQKIQDQLRNWFDNVRESLIQKIDWPTEGRVIAVPRPELTELFERICRMHNLNTSSTTDPVKKRSNILLAGVAMSIITVFIILAVGAMSGSGPTLDKDSVQQQKEGQSLEGFVHVILERGSQIIQGTDPAVEKANQIRQENLENLYKNQKTLFVQDFVLDSDASQNGEPNYKAFEDKLKEAFDAIYETYRSGSGSSKGLDDYVDLKSENVKSVDLKNQNAVNPWLRVKGIKTIKTETSPIQVLILDDLPQPEPDWNVLDGVDPVWFHKTIAALARLNKVKNNLDSRIGEVLVSEMPQIPDKYESVDNAAPRFFIYSSKYSDLDLAEQLRLFWAGTLLTGDKAETLENASFYQLKELAASSDTQEKYLDKHEKDSEEIKAAIRTLFPVPTPSQGEPTP